MIRFFGRKQERKGGVTVRITLGEKIAAACLRDCKNTTP
jgi:hypothetical protein